MNKILEQHHFLNWLALPITWTGHLYSKVSIFFFIGMIYWHAILVTPQREEQRFIYIYILSRKMMHHTIILSIPHNVIFYISRKKKPILEKSQKLKPYTDFLGLLSKIKTWTSLLESCFLYGMEHLDKKHVWNSLHQITSPIS